MKYAINSEKPFLDVGSADDPLHYGNMAIHVDIDPYPGFIQADV
jgi:hypothetical protein